MWTIGELRNTNFLPRVDDCYGVVEELARGGTARWGIAQPQVVVAGDSAGGNLAATVALRARDHQLPLALQLLIYPVIAPDFETASYQQLAEGFGLTRQVMQWFWQQYLSSPTDSGQAAAVPSRAANLAGVCPAHVITAEYDVLRDEGAAYARQLRDAGVDVSCQQYPGMLHGFVHFAGVFDDGIQAAEDLGRVIRQQLAAPN